MCAQVPPACSHNGCACVDTDWHSGMFFVGVFGFRAALYDVTVQVQGANSLIPGLSQTGYASDDQPAQYSLQVWGLLVGMGRGAPGCSCYCGSVGTELCAGMGVSLAIVLRKCGYGVVSCAHLLL